MTLSQQKTQLDTGERERLEDIAAEMRERVEDDISILQQIVCKDAPRLWKHFYSRPSSHILKWLQTSPLRRQVTGKLIGYRVLSVASEL